MILQPGQHWAGLQIQNNPAFVGRKGRPKQERGALLIARTIAAAQMLQRDGVEVNARNLHMFNPDLPEPLLAELLGSGRFAEAMEEQGVPFNQSGLSAHQLSSLAIYMDMTANLSHNQKLKLAQVTEAQWRGWMRQSAFAARLAAMSEELLQASVPVATQRLAQLADAGSLAAISIVHEMTGRHDRRKETIDINALLVAIFSILDEEIADVRVLNLISGKIRQRLMGQAPVLQITQIQQTGQGESSAENSGESRGEILRAD